MNAILSKLEALFCFDEQYTHVKKYNQIIVWNKWLIKYFNSFNVLI